MSCIFYTRVERLDNKLPLCFITISSTFIQKFMKNKFLIYFHELFSIVIILVYNCLTNEKDVQNLRNLQLLIFFLNFKCCCLHLEINFVVQS